MLLVQQEHGHRSAGACLSGASFVIVMPGSGAGRGLPLMGILPSIKLPAGWQHWGVSPHVAGCKGLTPSPCEKRQAEGLYEVVTLWAFEFVSERLNICVQIRIL